jgi:hypothetical protein
LGRREDLVFFRRHEKDRTRRQRIERIGKRRQLTPCLHKISTRDSIQHSRELNGQVERQLKIARFDQRAHSHNRSNSGVGRAVNQCRM